MLLALPNPPLYRRGDVVRVGICQPTDVEAFTIRSDYPAVIRGDPVWASSLAELDADTNGNVFFHDKTNGYVSTPIRF